MGSTNWLDPPEQILGTWEDIGLGGSWSPVTQADVYFHNIEVFY